MSTLSILVNCIILSVAFKEVFSMPENLGDTTMSLIKTEDIDCNNCPSTENPSKPNWPTGDDQWNSSHTRNVMIDGMACTCNLGTHGVPVRDDYKYTPGIGSHKFHTRAKVWNEARKICNEEGGHLAIINSIAEANVLKDIFKRSGPVKGSKHPFEALLGIHDLYSEGDWTTVHGESLPQTGYTEWTDKWNGQPDNWSGKQHCGAFLNEGAMDDVRCDEPFAFFCEIPGI